MLTPLITKFLSTVYIYIYTRIGVSGAVLVLTEGGRGRGCLGVGAPIAFLVCVENGRGVPRVGSLSWFVWKMVVASPAWGPGGGPKWGPISSTPLRVRDRPRRPTFFP